jgi:hypothetical protein
MSGRIAPSTRGILRTSSYQPGDSASSSEEGCSSADDKPLTRFEQYDRLAAIRRLPQAPVKPARRNVGRVTRTPRATPTRGSGLKGGSISFSNKVHVKEVPTIERSRSGDFFYDDEEIAEFRYEAHMEACGLDPADFD